MFFVCTLFKRNANIFEHVREDKLITHYETKKVLIVKKKYVQFENNRFFVKEREIRMLRIVVTRVAIRTVKSQLKCSRRPAHTKEFQII